MKRRATMLLFLAGALLLLVFLAVIALPLWFPWVATPLARKAGLTYASYERAGYGSFVLVKPVFRQGNVVVEAERVQALTPATWLWRLNGENRTASPYFQVRDWTLRIERDSSAKDPNEKEEATVNGQDSQTWPGLLEAVKKWLPSAVLTKGVVNVHGRTIQIPHANWQDGQLTARVKSQELGTTANFEADVRRMPYTAGIQISPAGAAINVSIQTNVPGNFISGSAEWESNKINFTAQFPASSAVPIRAEVVGTNLLISTARLGLDYYEDLGGSLTGLWENGAFQIKVTGTAKPTEQRFPPLTVEFVAEGNTKAALVRVARVEAPGLRVELSRDVDLLFGQPWLAEPAQLFVSAEFDRIKGATLRGTAHANVFMSPVESGVPSLTFVLKGTGIGYLDYSFPSISAEGLFAYPQLKVHELLAEVASGSTLIATGSGNITNNVIHDANITITSATPPAAIAKKVHWKKLDLSAAIRGPIKSLEHSGRLRADAVTSGKSPPIQVALDWKGRRMSLEQFELSAKAQTNALHAVGSMSFENQTLLAALAQLTISSNGVPLLALEKQPDPPPGTRSPAEVTLIRRPGGLTLRASPFALSGTAGELRVNGTLDWPASGHIEAAASELSTTLIQEFVPVPSARINALSVSADWSNSPVTFVLSSAVDAGYRGTLFSLEVRANGNATGTTIEQIAVAVSNAPVLIATGRIPLSLHPGATNIVAVDPQGPVKLTATAQPHGAVWDFVSGATGWKVEAPELLANVSGTWSAPTGRAQFRAGRVLPPGSGSSTPLLGPLNIVLHAEPGMLRVDPLEIDIQGQPLTASAELPLNKIPYKDLRETLRLERASANIRVEGASISAFTPWIKPLAPEGQVGFDLSMGPGFTLDGSLYVSGARTAPLGTLGPVRDITLRAKVTDNIATLEFARARIGGVPVALQGEARLNATNLAATPFRVAVKGSKVPLSRQPQAIIRGDINAVVIRTNGAHPIITGEVRLRDSFYLSDLAALIPGKVANPRDRPPYFSIEDKIIADWRLDLQATGQRGLRFRTPVVSGEVSPNIRLSGTLKNPVAVGDVTVNSGSVRFPFGSLDIQQGLITATTQDPTHPSISLNAAARQYGYDIRMDVSGRIDSPVLQFSSTPALSSDQILMMLTAGELPRGTGTLSAQQRAQSFAVFIGRDVLAKLGFGDQAADRLIIRSGEEFSEEGRPTYDVEYKLDKRWSVTGEYDRFGDFNAGFKWRVYSR